MHQEKMDQKEKQAALKKLRAARRDLIEKASARVKAQRRAVKAIREHLARGSGTVPEIARATGMPTGEVLWFLAALKKYGLVVEAEKDGSYFRYAWADKTVQDPSGCNSGAQPRLDRHP